MIVFSTRVSPRQFEWPPRWSFQLHTLSSDCMSSSSDFGLVCALQHFFSLFSHLIRIPLFMFISLCRRSIAFEQLMPNQIRDAFKIVDRVENELAFQCVFFIKYKNLTQPQPVQCKANTIASTAITTQAFASTEMSLLCWKIITLHFH